MTLLEAIAKDLLAGRDSLEIHITPGYFRVATQYSQHQLLATVSRRAFYTFLDELIDVTNAFAP